MNDTNPHAGGCSIVGVLTVVFIALKVTGLIDWSWWWVLSPLWIYTLLLLSILFIAAVVIAVIEVLKDEKKKGTKK